MSELDDQATARRQHHAEIGLALQTLADALGGFLTDMFADHLEPGQDWTEYLRRKDQTGSRRMFSYSSTDPSLMLRILTDNVVPRGTSEEWDRLPRTARAFASELRDVRNRWAHNVEFNAQQVARCIDTVQLLLSELNLTAYLEQLERLAAARTESVTAGDTGDPTTMASGEHGGADDPQSADAGRTLGLPRSVDISSLGYLSYAMANSRCRIVSQVMLPAQTLDQRGAYLELEVTSALGSHGGPAVHHVDLAAGEPLTLSDPPLALDPAAMVSITERTPAQIRASLYSSVGHLLADGLHDVMLLAAQEWLARPLHLSAELLAAYVQPHAGAVADLLLRATDLLGEGNGPQSLEGYQGDSPERVDAIVEAIWDALRERDLRYAEPPASWGLNGQLVRTPNDVIDGRLATCLDSTLVLAAALEQAGINSVLWLFKDHALMAYWREDRSLGAPALSDDFDIVNLVDLALLAPVETTLVCGGGASASFEAARVSGETRVRTMESVAATDIREAREAGIHPLPSRRPQQDGSVIITEYRPAERTRLVPPTVAAAARPSADHSSDHVPRRVSDWKNSLLDLSLRNRLINYTSSTGVRLLAASADTASVEDLLHRDRDVTLLASDAVPPIEAARGIQTAAQLSEEVRSRLLHDRGTCHLDLTEARYTTRLRSLASKAKTIIQETGANNLFLAVGMLRWRTQDGRELRSPLILTPVTIAPSTRGGTYRLALDETGTSTPNYCLLEKLRLDLGLSLPGLQEPELDDAGMDVDGVFASVRDVIARSNLPFRVEEALELAILQFAKFSLWRDLDLNWKELSRNSLVAHLIHTPNRDFADPVSAPAEVDLDALHAEVPISADASQLDAIADATAGRTFVLEGPPGTGKSQTITNLLAHALASGKKVLFVAEKRAALDVVKKRLDAVGLGDFSLDLHDRDARPAAVRAQIKSAMDVDPTTPPRVYDAAVEETRVSRQKLARYAENLHASNPAGLSLYSAREHVLASRTVAPLGMSANLVAGIDQDVISAHRAALRRMPDVADRVGARERRAWGFLTRVSLTAEAVFDRFRRLDVVLKAAADRPWFEAVLTSSVPAGLLDRLLGLAGAPAIHPSNVAAAESVRVENQLRETARRIDAMSTRPARWTEYLRPSALAADVNGIHMEAAAAHQAGFFGRKRRRRAALSRLAEHLLVEAKSFPLRDLASVTAELKSDADELTTIRRSLDVLPSSVIDAAWHPFDEAARQRATWELIAIADLAVQLRARDSTDAAARRFFDRSPAERMADGPLLHELRGALEVVGEVLQRGAPHLGTWTSGQSFLRQWVDSAGSRDLDRSGQLQGWLELIECLEPLAADGLLEAHAQLLGGQIDADEAVRGYDAGLAGASVEERLESGGLRAVASRTPTGDTKRFDSGTTILRHHLPQVIPSRIMSSRAFDPQASGGAVGGLRRQLERQRGGLPVRRLMSEYGEIILSVMPCVLASPQSVSRFLAARNGLFDIVVFDEASQIRVADAIGAMGRSRSVVIVGDSKQMPPTSFAQITAGSREDDAESRAEDAVVVEDEESILTECVAAAVARKRLSWHYRSQDETLIAFSNVHYYESKLSSFPAPPSDARRDLGISWVRLDGQFQRSGAGRLLRTNQVEAEAIVAEIQRRFTAEDQPSLGVVTFNAQQRDLIENQLRDAGNDRIIAALEEPDGLFVKNLENVQGDERDTILFSVAFSKNDKGMVPLNFGPLTPAGGERRFNVAITRARRQVIMYSSFDPEEIRETSSVGIRHLKAYLELARDSSVALRNGHFRAATADLHRDDIAAALRQQGLVVQTDVGLSGFRVDLTLASQDSPNRPRVAVLLDSPTWRQRRTVADRDSLPTHVLRQMGWPAIERVWLPQWLLDQQSVIASLLGAMTVADRMETVTSRPAPQTAAPTFRERSVLASTPHPVSLSGGRPPAAQRRTSPHLTQFLSWRPVRVGRTDVLDELPGHVAAEKVRRSLTACVEAEQPIHRERLAKLVASAFGLERVRAARAGAILACVPRDLQRTENGVFYWTQDIRVDSWLSVRVSEDLAVRPLDHIALVELANALRVKVAEFGGAEVEEAKRAALTLFGGSRMTSTISSRLDKAVQVGVRSGRLALRERTLVALDPPT